MLTFDVICPFCGKVNRNLYLGETSGWMECENCHQIVHDPTTINSSTVSAPILTPEPVARRFGAAHY